jgi:hypothetical protein
MHDLMLTTAQRQIGRTRVTDHFWRCSCGEATTAPNGFSAQAHAWVNGLAHRRKYVPPNRKEINPMSTPNPTGESTNLTSSIKFCEASASSARDLVGEVETFTASLSAAGVSGEPLRLAANAMELAEELGSVFDDLAGELQRHTVVAEAYQSVGDDAGDKQFNQVT